MFILFQVTEVTAQDIVQLQQAKGTPLQYMVSPDRLTVDSPFGKVQLGSILLYQVQTFNMIKHMQQRDYNIHQSSLQFSVSKIKLMKGKALRKHSLHEKTAASVLLKLFISGNE